MFVAFKGFTNQGTYLALKDYVQECSFDLRPRSFNFTPMSVVNELISSSKDLKIRSLLFANESNLMVEETLKNIDDKASDIIPEFSGIISIKERESLEQEFFWHFHEETKLKELLKEIEKSKFLRRVILPHSILEKYHSENELFGFLNLIKSAGEDLEFELLIDWDTALIESVFSYFTFSTISIEANSKVEISYQNLDLEIVKQELLRINKLRTLYEDTNIK